MTHTKVATDRKRGGRWAFAAIVAAALLATPVAVPHAVGATSDGFTGPVSMESAQSATRSDTQSAAPSRRAGLIGVAAPSLTPGLPPPHLSSLSDRRIVAGVILVLFAGLGTLTVSMWRELGRRAGL